MLLLCPVTALFQLGYCVLTCHETPVLQAVSLHVFSFGLFFSLFQWKHISDSDFGKPRSCFSSSKVKPPHQLTKEATWLFSTTLPLCGSVKHPASQSLCSQQLLCYFIWLFVILVLGKTGIFLLDNAAGGEKEQNLRKRKAWWSINNEKHQC